MHILPFAIQMAKLCAESVPPFLTRAPLVNPKFDFYTLPLYNTPDSIYQPAIALDFAPEEGDAMKTYLLGTGICIVAAGIVIVVGVAKLPVVNALWAIPVVLVGIGIQFVGLLQNRPRPPR